MSPTQWARSVRRSACCGRRTSCRPEAAPEGSVTMTDEELGFLPATRLVRQIRQKKISPVEVIGTILKRIERLEPKLNAMTYIGADRAMDAARKAETALMQG